MKQLFSLIMLLFLVGSVNAVVFEAEDQDQVMFDYSNSNTNMAFDRFIVGTDNLQYSFNNVTFTYDYREDLKLDTDYYIIFTNSVLNGTYKFLLTTDFSEGGSANTVTYTLIAEEIGEYFVKISPTVDNEDLRLEIDMDDSYLRNTDFVVVSNTVVNEANSFFTPLIDAVVDLVKININIWKLFYYILVSAIILSVVFGFILVGKRIYDASKDSPQFNFGKGRH